MKKKQNMSSNSNNNAPSSPSSPSFDDGLNNVSDEEEAKIYPNSCVSVGHAPDSAAVAASGSLLMQFIRNIKPGLDLFRISVPA